MSNKNTRGATLLRLLLTYLAPQYEVAEHAGITNSYLSQLADGRVKQPQPEYLEKLADYFSGFFEVEVEPSALLRNVNARNVVLLAQRSARPIH